MPDPHPNVLTYLAAIDAFNRNDVTAIGDYVRPDFVYRIPGCSRVAGMFRGLDGFVEASLACEMSPQGPSSSRQWPCSPMTRTLSRAPESPLNETASGSTPRTVTRSGSSPARLPTGRSSCPTPIKVDDFWTTKNEPCGDIARRGMISVAET
jgi:hypothetical protein